MKFHFFDRDQPIDIVERRLPHWDQPATMTFVTFRTDDSMPQAVVKQWLNERDRWLQTHDIDSACTDWREQLLQLESQRQQEFHQRFSSRWHDELDHCHGACVLRADHRSKIVADSLLHLDGENYLMMDFVVMPNHVHLLAAFENQQGMLKQCESWKRFTARQINQSLGQRGRFWQQDAFDHLVRSESQFLHLRKYIADNPSRAGLQTGEYQLYQRPPN